MTTSHRSNLQCTKNNPGDHFIFTVFDLFIYKNTESWETWFKTIATWNLIKFMIRSVHYYYQVQISSFLGVTGLAQKQNWIPGRSLLTDPAGIWHIIIEMVNNCCLCFIKLDTTFASKITNSLSNVGRCSNKNIATTINETCNGWNVHRSTKLYSRYIETKCCQLSFHQVYDLHMLGWYTAVFIINNMASN